MRSKKPLYQKYATKILATLLSVVILSSCSVLRSTTYTSSYYPYHILENVEPGYTQIGIASWYGPNFNGKKTANGEIYNMYAHTAASKTLPFNTTVKVINLNNGKSTVVRINDRGPFVKNRIIDLSYAAAQDIDMIKTGTAPVKVVVLGNNPSSTQSTTIIRKPKIEQLDKIKINTNIDNTYTKNFSIQVGSFRLLANALKLRDRLANNLKNVYIQKKLIDGTIFYRVLVGNFPSRKLAQDFAFKNITPFVPTYCIIRK